VHSSEKWTTIEVSDDGPGIPEKERGRVFDSFYRVEGSGEVGAGLGLSIVRAIVDRLGGTIGLDWTDAAQRKGLRVTLCLASSSNNVLDSDGVVGPTEASAVKDDRPNSALLRVG
jgi:two-component system OmpR family sensor kinase